MGLRSCLVWLILVPCRAILLSKPWQNVSAGGAVEPRLLPAAMRDADIKLAMKSTPWDPLEGWGARHALRKDEAVNAVKHAAQSAQNGTDVQAKVDPTAARAERDELLCMLKKDFPEHEVQGHIPHSHTCAVVSNSGTLDLHSHGPSIDKVDTVFRFNLAPAGGQYKGKVGEKESIRFINDRAAQESLVTKPTDVAFHMLEQAVIVPFAEPSMEVLQDIQTFSSMHENVQLLLMEQRTLEEGEALLKKVYDTQWFHDGVSFKPTSGFVGMLFALSVCDTVHAYGMAATPQSADAPYHYYRSGEEHEGKDANDNGWHKSFPAEKDLWRRLALSKASLDNSDWVEIPGFSTFSC